VAFKPPRRRHMVSSFLSTFLGHYRRGFSIHTQCHHHGQRSVNVPIFVDIHRPRGGRAMWLNNPARTLAG
jgi:hypothetical protein